MEGNIVYVDYELSSWKYQNEEYAPSKYLPYIRGEAPLPPNSGIVIKSGCVLREDTSFKGMGSAYGGDWKPVKETDKRFLGRPGEIKETTIPTTKGSYRVETKIGPDGRAIMERHHTDHGSSKKHTVPHDHAIDWSRGFPDPGGPINYPNGAPEFKTYGGGRDLSEIKHTMWDPEEYRFKSISDFKWCMACGGEVQFEWKGKCYGVYPKLQKAPDSPIQMCITQNYIDDPEATEMWCDTADELLEYMVGSDRLRDVITQVEVIDRTI